MLQEAIDTILKKEMDRKEFLLYIGLFLFALTGISHLLKSLQDPLSQNMSHGFGGGPYGGTLERKNE